MKKEYLKPCINVYDLSLKDVLTSSVIIGEEDKNEVNHDWPW